MVIILESRASPSATQPDTTIKTAPYTRFGETGGLLGMAIIEESLREDTRAGRWVNVVSHR